VLISIAGNDEGCNSKVCKDSPDHVSMRFVDPAMLSGVVERWECTGSDPGKIYISSRLGPQYKILACVKVFENDCKIQWFLEVGISPEVCRKGDSKLGEEFSLSILSNCLLLDYVGPRTKRVWEIELPVNNSLLPLPVPKIV
jgi:hypothetical protein